MYEFAKSLLVSGALVVGSAQIDPVDNAMTPSAVNEVPFIFSPQHAAPDTFYREAAHVTPQMERAAEKLDDFALQVPGVLYRRIRSVMTYGTKAVIMQDATTKQGEDQMITSLIDSLNLMGNALSDDIKANAQ